MSHDHGVESHVQMYKMASPSYSVWMSVLFNQTFDMIVVWLLSEEIMVLFG